MNSKYYSKYSMHAVAVFSRLGDTHVSDASRVGGARLDLAFF